MDQPGNPSDQRERLADAESTRVGPGRGGSPDGWSAGDADLGADTLGLLLGEHFGDLHRRDLRQLRAPGYGFLMFLMRRVTGGVGGCVKILKVQRG